MRCSAISCALKLLAHVTKLYRGVWKKSMLRIVDVMVKIGCRSPWASKKFTILDLSPVLNCTNTRILRSPI